MIVEELQQQVSLATAAAHDAYRDTTRLIRLLSVLGQPVGPEQLLEQSLRAVSEVFRTDITALARRSGDRLVLSGACGLAEDDPALFDGWPLPEPAGHALRTGQVVNHSGPAVPQLPDSAAALGVGSAAWIPLSRQPAGSDDLLVLLRRDPRPFSGADLQVLGSVASRLRVALEERERSIVIERLARYGHRLARHLELSPLLDEAVEQLRQLIDADQTWAVTIEGDQSQLRAHRGLSPEEQAAWPQPVHTVEEGHPPPRREGEPESSVPALLQAGATALRVPVVHDGALVAVLYARRRCRGAAFAADAPEVAAIFANYLAVAMVNADLYRALHLRATHDPLTGLANRVMVGQYLEQALAPGHSGRVGVLFCDLDRFKAVNDFHGHEVGDDLLQQVTERLRGSVRPQDLLARFGGDEFVIVLDSVRSLAEVAEVGERMCRALDREFMVRGERVRVSISVGGVLGVPGRTTASLLLRNADAAMYVAKERGFGQVEVFDEAASHRSLDRLDLRAELAHALERGEFEVRYQPIVALSSGAVVAFEALLRWHHPRHGTVPPEVFVPLAEDTGAIVRLGDWVLKQACRQLRAWQGIPGAAGLAASVNLSAAQLRQPHAVEQMLATIRATGVALGDVWLEVTEHGHVCDQVAARAAALQAAGVRFALDDFGTASSSLSHLQRFPIDLLKIDMCFVHGMTERVKDHRIVHAVLSIADSMRLTAVAEGIETEEQRAALQALGCPLGQGHLLAPPLAADEAERLLRRQVTTGQLGPDSPVTPAPL